MKKLLAAILVAAAALGLSGCMVISCEEPRPPRHVAVYIPPRPPREVIVVPGPRPPHYPPVYRRHID